MKRIVIDANILIRAILGVQVAGEITTWKSALIDIFLT